MEVIFAIIGLLVVAYLLRRMDDTTGMPRNYIPRWRGWGFMMGSFINVYTHI